MRLTRLAIIVVVALKYGLDEFLTGHERFRAVRPLARALTFWRDTSAPRAERLRLALVALGPIFVKFGQMLSTRRDLLPPDIADELAKLQDRVPPFPFAEVESTLMRRYGKPVHEVFRAFDETPIASASVAQVHFAELPDGTPVAVKVLRPRIGQVIEKDISLMHAGATLLEKLWSDGKRLRPRAVVAEFEKTLRDELDLTREAANCSQLRRNFEHSSVLLVPAVYWDYCGTEVMVMERMSGIPIGQVERPARGGHRHSAARPHRCRSVLHAGVPRRVLPRRHAPGQHLRRHRSREPRQVHRRRLRDHGHAVRARPALPRRQLPRLLPPRLPAGGDGSPGIGMGAPDTRMDDLEAEIRVVLEPAFDRPLSEISLGRVLLALFRASRRFNVEIQPQLVLLQKTLLNVEGLGRQLDPNLNLWVTAMPFLERWMEDRIGVPALRRRFLAEAPYIVAALPELPRLIHQRLTTPPAVSDTVMRELTEAARTQNRLLTLIALLLAIAAGILLWKVGAG
jgi:ubiquinone biosynthesis protein